jgi:hypothetical protein
MAELGKIERPSAESFAGKRKLYCVPGVYPLEGSPEDYAGLVGRYWEEVFQQTEKLEVAGKVKKIFCENISLRGKKALDTFAAMNEPALRIVKKKIDEGAELLPLESEEIFGPFVDWSNCLHVVRTKEVFHRVFEFYTDLAEKRLQHALRFIEENLSEGEAGLLIMRDEDRAKLQFPPDIEVFLVTPPSYDDILRWLREKMKELQKQSPRHEDGGS